MSEAIPGLPPAPKAGKPRDASSVILYRRVEGGVELFWLRRERTLSFAGGYYAFPGGSVDASDALVPVDGVVSPDNALRVAAARELFEEVGVLLGAQARPVSAEELSTARRALIENKKPFAQLLSELGVSLRAQDFREAGRWITPAFMPRRFDARFFLAEAPAGAHAESWPGEAEEGSWIRPADALARWEAGTALLHPPALHALRTMAEFKSPDSAQMRLSTPAHCPAHIPSRIEFQCGIRVFPLETPTLPPATHTNAYVLGNGELLIVDPGAKEVRQCARLLALIAGLKSEGKRPKAVVLTHHHADHIGGARAVMERLGIPLWCHERTADRVSELPVERLLKDGDVITLSGVPSTKWQVLHTPGHARGHICLVDEASRAAVCGDMVAGFGTILIDPPEGDMTDYLAQLARLRDSPVTTLYPSHGPAIPDGPAKLSEYIRHREHREKLVLDAIPAEGATIHQIVPVAYADVGEAVFPVAERSTQAILIKLVRENRVQRKDDRYFKA